MINGPFEKGSTVTFNGSSWCWIGTILSTAEFGKPTESLIAARSVSVKRAKFPREDERCPDHILASYNI
ncbi:hypothetical protein PO124_27400 [Bacillus licheniformis]|nr:hypothetical protein [Bacillus licheniformis]